MTKLQEIRTEIWLNCYYDWTSRANKPEVCLFAADQFLKEFDSRFPVEPANPIPTNEKPVMPNGGKWLSILEAETALESASEIINTVVCMITHPSGLEASAKKWLKIYYPDQADNL